MASDEPKLPFGLDVAHLTTMGTALVAFIGSAYVANYRLSQVEAEMVSLHQLVLEETKVATVQSEVMRILDDFRLRIERLERRNDRNEAKPPGG